MEKSISDNVYLIDNRMNHITGLGAVYLIKGEETCLIDAGPKEGSSHIISKLREYGVFPPDNVILTHSHSDHTQGLQMIREKAKAEGKDPTVFAHELALPHLEDQSFNKVFDPKLKLTNFTDITPVKEGSIIDLNNIQLQIIEVPGHINDHVAIYDEETKTLYSGDALGTLFLPNHPLPTFMPPFFNYDQYLESIAKCQTFELNNIALGHYGFIQKAEIPSFFDQLLTTCHLWWEVLEKVEEENQLDDMDYLLSSIFDHTTLSQDSLTQTNFELVKTSQKLAITLINNFRKILRKDPINITDILIPMFLEWTVKGYTHSKLND